MHAKQPNNSPRIMDFTGLTLTNFLHVVLLIVSCIGVCLSHANETITPANFITDPDTLSSNNTDFKLGFFSPPNSTNRYVGIWYLSPSNVIWIANRNQPLKANSSRTVTISEDGNLVVLNRKNMVVWSSNVTHDVTTNPVAKLLDTGNLVLLDGTTGEVLWESFQYPSDVLVPGMNLSTNRITGEKTGIISWKSPSDPSVGYYSATLERPSSAPEVFLWVNGIVPYFRSGPWNGRIFIGTNGYLCGWSVGNEDDGTVHLSYSFANRSEFGLMALTTQGHLRLVWWNNKKEMLRYVTHGTYCDHYAVCGAFGSCNWKSSPTCSCLSGYEPKNLEEWNGENWTSGCVRRVPLQCGGLQNGTKDGFLKLENMKVPNFLERLDFLEDECRTRCLENCSCVAYAYESGIGCMVWSGDLVDIQRFSIGGVDLYIRVASSELEKYSDKRRDKRLIIAVGVTTGIITLACCAFVLWKWTAIYTESVDTRKTYWQSERPRMKEDQKQVKLDDQFPHFTLEELATATNNFHSTNMLGKGGFGSVYKGRLKGGQDIAVKRLSKTSRQGLEECMNEALVISKLQHHNLVRLLGCCMEQEEKMLVYEYMPNKSLDLLLFDQVKKKDLDWPKRFNIIEGIARGLLYLHKDSRLKIIHRDLKVSNILLDGELNPKISDFGMARIFGVGGSDTQANTRRVVGTFGYMPPEYVLRGLFSEKSDVFSFGVLLLEIVSGRKSSSCHDYDQSSNLLGFAWKLWNERDIQSLIDPEISNPDYVNEISRCIHIGLLCVQEIAKKRPSMARVVPMLNSEIVNLPLPSHPAFLARQIVCGAEPSSINHITITKIQGR